MNLHELNSENQENKDLIPDLARQHGTPEEAINEIAAEDQERNLLKKVKNLSPQAREALKQATENTKRENLD